MSRTDKTKPFWVKIADGDLKAVESHNHTDGACDLPDPHDAVAFTRLTTQCRREFVYTGTNTCGCKNCACGSGQTNDHRRRRDRRRQERADRDWRKDYERATTRTALNGHQKTANTLAWSPSSPHCPGWRWSPATHCRAYATLFGRS